MKLIPGKLYELQINDWFANGKLFPQIEKIAPSLTYPHRVDAGTRLMFVEKKKIADSTTTEAYFYYLFLTENGKTVFREYAPLEAKEYFREICQ